MTTRDAHLFRNDVNAIVNNIIHVSESTWIVGESNEAVSEQTWVLVNQLMVVAK